MYIHTKTLLSVENYFQRYVGENQEMHMWFPVSQATLSCSQRGRSFEQIYSFSN